MVEHRGWREPAAATVFPLPVGEAPVELLEVQRPELVQVDVAEGRYGPQADDLGVALEGPGSQPGSGVFQPALQVFRDGHPPGLAQGPLLVLHHAGRPHLGGSRTLHGVYPRAFASCFLGRELCTG